MPVTDSPASDSSIDIQLHKSFIPTLTKPSEFPSWSESLLIYLECKKFDRVLKTTARQTRSSKNLSSRQLQLMNRVVLATIKSKLAPHYRTDVEHITDPKTLWNHLQLKFVGDRSNQLQKATHHLTSLRFETLDQLFSRFRSGVSHYRSLGGKAPDHDLCQHLFNLLPNQYYQTIQIAKSMSEDKDNLNVAATVQIFYSLFTRQELHAKLVTKQRINKSDNKENSKPRPRHVIAQNPTCKCCFADDHKMETCKYKDYFCRHCKVKGHSSNFCSHWKILTAKHFPTKKPVNNVSLGDEVLTRLPCMMMKLP